MPQSHRGTREGEKMMQIPVDVHTEVKTRGSGNRVGYVFLFEARGLYLPT